MATSEARAKLVVAPFGVEADHPRNCDLAIQSIPGCKLRGRLISYRTVKDARTGEERIPKDQGRHLGSLPEIPGMRLHVNPAKLSYTIEDPLFEDEDLCKRIFRSLEEDERPIVGDREKKQVKGVPPQSGTLDKHRMKTLCRELLGIVNAKEAQIVKGPKPEMEDIDELPGDYLLNPGSRVQNMQPTFEKDWDGWVQRLAETGG